MLMKAISMYGKPEEILSDHGTTFYALESDEREKGLTEFEKFSIKEKITLIVGRVDTLRQTERLRSSLIYLRRRLSSLILLTNSCNDKIS